jgi:hypothetical protein
MTWIKGTERLDGFSMIVLVPVYFFYNGLYSRGGESRPIYEDLCITEGYNEK